MSAPALPKPARTAGLFVLAALATGIAHGAGFQITESSVTGLGRAFAGSGLVGDDLSAIAYNPAGLTLLDGGMSYADLVALATERRDLMHPGGPPWEWLRGIEPLPHVNLRERDGFKLTDARANGRDVLSEINYCVLCHERDKDSCSKGLKEPAAKGNTDVPAKIAVNALGIEPLTDDFSGDWLYQATRARRAPIKPVLMDAHLIVGIGNIYASESLFLAGISPLRAACRIGRERCERLAGAVKETLAASIAAGGSSVRHDARRGPPVRRGGEPRVAPDGRVLDRLFHDTRWPHRHGGEGGGRRGCWRMALWRRGRRERREAHQCTPAALACDGRTERYGHGTRRRD